MHLLRTETLSLDQAAQAVDLGQSPAEIVFLSFTDSDLAAFAAAWEDAGPDAPSLRVANLAQLRHPYSVDLYVANVAARARFVLVRLLGGKDYWPYGVEELSAAARREGFHLAVVPGDHMADARLDAASTLPEEDLRRLWGWFHEGGPDNLRQCLAFLADRLGRRRAWREPVAVPAFGLAEAFRRAAAPDAPRALVVFYRSVLMAADTAPVAALADALSARGFAVDAAHVSSLKDPEAAGALSAFLARRRPDVILNTTAFSGRAGDAPGVLDEADAPVIQAILAGAREEAWRVSARGLAAADLAMNVVLPELDGRIVGRAISFKAEAPRSAELEATLLRHRPAPSRVAAVADLAAAWARLRRTPAAGRRIACVLSDYPAKGGRTGYAVGLDTTESVKAIAADLRDAGYDVGDLPVDLMRALETGEPAGALALDAYAALFDELPSAFRASVLGAWGAPGEDDALRDGAFRFRIARAGRLVVALQPDRGRRDSRKGDYHDVNLPPRHAYVAFYLWLRRVEAIHALVHCGTHGTLEWLPGKAVALDESCAPEAVLGPTPVVYPFIVNNPGEAAQAKRRIAAVTVGHLSPPLVAAGQHGGAAEVEALFDEYAAASELDPGRARLLARAILDRATETGLSGEASLAAGDDPETALQKLDAWLCDLKEMRIGDGLHIFGRAAAAEARERALDAWAESDAATRAEAARALDACPAAERDGLLAALDGRFVPPGPAGAPLRGRVDVLPTGRNLYTVDPRAVPTRTAWEIGRRAADEVLTRHVQDHGDWPRRLVIDLWGSATMRTGGDDLAQALALIGARPVWDHASTRVSGFEILPCASLGRPRVDVALHVSGLFRDVFPGAIALFDEAARAVAALDEDDGENPLAEARRASPERAFRVFGAAPGAYGAGLSGPLASGAWENRADLGEAYLAAGAHAYGKDAEGVAAREQFDAVVAGADAYVHARDLEGQDALDADALAHHTGGFAAAAARLGASPALYHADTSRAGRVVARTAREEVARALRGRAANPRWIAGQMRHGHRGAAEIAESVDNLFAWAALADAVDDRQFDLMFDATCGDEAVRAFLGEANPRAACAIASRFDEAIRRGLWRCRRNSVPATLSAMMEMEP
ncbi:cobaltochelatase subunit CobN [Alsobacter sp. SYSU M60028]|uniref:Cobaltochelatase subunit CobN n=1 Tax=Alsobacter ponti TaxID=2962936 RepID=A0ABT1LH77_9HYPH|nr:cobaltochelatase subunit CobN [Alsobacter ponti]MCP8940860.1 cobaltochelatase subunit CobN [Alsobacter ponti]